MSSVDSAFPFPILVADIGGTNARFGLVVDQDQPPKDVCTLKCADFPGLVAATESYLSEVGQRCPQRVAFAVATPVTGDQINLTNSAWSFSIAAARRQLGTEQLTVLNDFTAQALAVPLLRADDLQQVGGGAAIADQPLAVLGPGTGLGVSGLIPCHGAWMPLSGEGGHVSFSPFDERETAILSLLRKDYAHVSAERLISGMGLVNLYETIAVLEGRRVDALTPALISERGMRGTCEVCAEALASFCAMLGTVAANLVLTLGARGGVYLGGGIIPKLGQYFFDSRFRERFESKGRFSDYLAQVPSYVIKAQNPALTGLAGALSGAMDRGPHRR